MNFHHWKCRSYVRGSNALNTLLKISHLVTFSQCSGTIENGYSVPPVIVKRLVPGGLAESHGVMVGDCLHKVGVQVHRSPRVGNFDCCFQINGADVTENYVEEIVQVRCDGKSTILVCI